MRDEVRKKIQDTVSGNKVVLFMKGTKNFPQCGFSARVVQALKKVGEPFVDVNVLADPEVREGIKEFSEWPTIPQLYVRGQFVGGCDIVKDMKASGELQQLLGSQAPVATAPRITITRAARENFAAALSEAAGDVLHLSIDPAFQADLFLAPAAPSKVRTEC